jgi:DNA-binding winged helix-turn-helix (wHTH) protein/Tfp pilus assembly protein PilF
MKSNRAFWPLFRVVKFNISPRTISMGSSAQAPPTVVRFGVFEADLRAGELRRNGIKVRVQDLPFRALTLLLTNPGRVITREEFRQALWGPDIFVDFEQGISSAMMRLRDALGDSAENPIFVETVERRGYRWIAPIHPSDSTKPKPQEGPAEQPPEQDSRRWAQGDEPASEEIAVDASPGKKTRYWQILALLIVFLAILGVTSIVRSGFRAAKIVARHEITPARAQHQPANREAEDWFLKGRFYWNERTPESLNQAVDAFTQAIVHDPKYADAYMGLADCYNLMREFSVLPDREAFDRAFVAAQKAVQFDDSSSEAHASLAFALFNGKWDVQAADREYRRAIALDPNNAKAHHWYATFLNGLRLRQRALDEIEIARRLDPNSRSILADKGILLVVAGHRKEGTDLLTQLETVEPDFISPHRYLKMAYLDAGDYPGYLRELRREAQLQHNDAFSEVAESSEQGYAAGGASTMFARQFEKQEKLYQAGKLSPIWVADTSARMGRAGEAMKYLNLCYESRCSDMLYIINDEGFRPLYGLPGFQQLVAKIGLPPVN